LTARDKVNLDIFWLRDESLEETANLPEPDVLAAEIVDDLEAALEQFRAIAEDLGEEQITPHGSASTPSSSPCTCSGLTDEQPDHVRGTG
jgi:hypothetical protein